MKSDRPNNRGKTSKTPRRPFGKDRLDSELQICGDYGLKCKRELWRVQLLLSNIRKAARVLLTLDEKDERRIFEGDALLDRLTRLGLLDSQKRSLDYVLNLTTKEFLEARLQTQAYKTGLAKSIHMARVLTRHGHITVNNRRVNVPGFMVHVDSSKRIQFDVRSPMHPSGGRPGRVAKRKKKGGVAEDE